MEEYTSIEKLDPFPNFEFMLKKVVRYLGTELLNIERMGERTNCSCMHCCPGVKETSSKNVTERLREVIRRG